MKHQDYSNIGALIALDSDDIQASVVEAFEAVGMTAPLQARDDLDLRHLLGKSNLDLILVSSTLKSVNVASMIGEIRRGKLGPHPFPIIIAVVDASDAASLRRVSDCGPDDIVALPCAPQALLDRINGFLAGERRPLVVNDGYAGPERRVEDRV